MNELVNELLLRLGKVGLAALLGLAFYAVATAVLGEPASVGLALLSWLAGAALLHLLSTNPL
jgi:hypothetical protein